MDPLSLPAYCLVRESVNGRGVPPTPSAAALRACLSTEGRLQVGSRFADVGTIWFRPLGGGRWYVDKPSSSWEDGAVRAGSAPVRSSASPSPLLGEEAQLVMGPADRSDP